MDKMIEKIKKQFLQTCKRKNIKPKRINTIWQRIENQYKTKQTNYLSKIKFKRVFSLGKKRSVAYIQDKFCLEYYLIKYFANNIKEIKQNSLCNMSVPTKQILNYFQSLESTQLTIIRFDFKNYYNNLSSQYIYQKYLKNYTLSQTENYFLKDYTNQVPYCFAGLSASNLFAEIIDKDLEVLLNTEFNKIANSVCFHYGDDFNIFVNKKIDKNFALDIILSTIQNCFHSKNVTCTNQNKEKIHTNGDKFTLLTSDNLPIKFNFLGYEYNVFLNCGKIDFDYGVVDYTIHKFKQNLKNTINLYKDNVEAQRIVIMLNTARLTYPIDDNNYVSTRFHEQTKCLRFAPQKLNQKTLNFLQNAIFECYSELGIKLPYFLNDKAVSSKYNLFHNLMNGKAMYFNNHFGVPKQKLIKMAKALDIDPINQNYVQIAKQITTKTKIDY